MATLTTNYNFSLPVIGGDIDAWGAFLNANFTLLDNLLHGSAQIRPALSEGNWKIGATSVLASAAELNKLDGVTASTAELNKLAGLTSLTADLNLLSGASAAGLSAAELLFVNGVTSAIQTQIDTISAAVANAVPAGAVAHFARSTAPSGWLAANGALVSRATYATLFAAIGTTFGAGDGSTTFQLPDLRGEFVRGYDDGRGIDSGRVFGSLQAEDLKSHIHGQQVGGVDQDRGVAVGNIVSGTNIGNGLRTANESTLATGGTETRPRNVALLACIKT